MKIPDRETVAHYFRYYLLLGAVFFLVYGGSNYLASLRAERYGFFLDIERYIPFVPQSIIIYLSICLLFLLPVFYVNVQRTVALAKAFLFTSLFAGVCFVVLPADLAHCRPDVVNFLPWLFKLLYSVALPHNFMPSLHIAYTVLFLGVCISLESNRRLVLLYLLWGGLLFVSVLLMRQHQIIDVFTGSALGLFAYRGVYLRSLQNPLGNGN